MAINFRVEDDFGLIEFDLPDSKVNLLTFEVLDKLDKTLDDVASRNDLKALVFLSHKPNVFIAGADIKEIEQITEPGDGKNKAKFGQDILNKIEDLPFPTVAVIDGVALGGGCELALACQYRLATFNEKVLIGLPEIQLGFVPGFGGTYRLPRVVGLQQGLKMILSGKAVDGKKALRIGLVNHLIPQENMMKYVLDFLDKNNDAKTSSKYKRSKTKGFARLLDETRLGQTLVFSQSLKSVMKLTKGFYPAPPEGVHLIKKTFYFNREEGLALEASTFGELAITDVSKSLVKVFYLREEYKKLSLKGAEDVKPQPIEKSGVLGAGVMGGGIAQLLSYKGIWVRLKDINYDAIGKGFQAAAKVFKQAVKKRKITKYEAAKMMGRITGTLDYTGFEKADFVIEAVVEKMEIKKKVFKELSSQTKDSAILASNTSALSVLEMANETDDPSKVIGFHFFNPVHRMPLVEVITTPKTSQETIVTSLALVKRLGKIPILVKDSCGFVVNRILLGYINEAGRLLEECGDIEHIDQVATKFGMPMGPFLLSDEVGLDVGIKVLKILEDSFGERYKPVEVFEKVYDKGLLGKKTGKGFYEHKKQRVVNPEITQLLSVSVAGGLNEYDAIDRLIYIMINEAAQCLEEGIVDHASAIDVGMIFGTGFPPFRGGLLRYADSVGIARVVERLEELADKYKNDAFKPVKYLKNLKSKKESFYS